VETQSQDVKPVAEQAPFDPRRESSLMRPPPQPSVWLEPVVRDEEPPDEVVVLEDDDPPPSEVAVAPEVAPPGPEELVDASTGATPARITGRRPGSPAKRRLVTPTEASEGQPRLTAEQRLLVLDTWRRSGLPGGDFAPLVGVSRYTLYAWKARFEAEGPAGLVEKARGKPKGSRLPEALRRAIIMMKESNPEWGVERISDMLARGPGMAASPTAVSRVLKEWGCEVVEQPTRPHRDHVRSFERATPNQLWQTDLFTFVLKRQNQRVYLVAFLDDHSRYVVSYGLHASQSTALVLEVFRAGIASYGTPEEVLTDNGSQYVTWRGKSAFASECEKRGIKHSAGLRPQPNCRASARAIAVVVRGLRVAARPRPRHPHFIPPQRCRAIMRIVGEE